jgi:pyrroline-5-carboxylate reductase
MHGSADGLCRITNQNAEVVSQSDIIVIAVKPAVVSVVLEEIKASMSAEQLQSKCFISIAAGVSIDALQSKLTPGVSFIRVMPNTPCSVGECAAAYSLGTHSTQEHQKKCEAIFNSVGTVCQVSESIMDGVTGLSGSGPACE